MLFPVSGVETSLWIPPLVACLISFFTSMGGVSGAFLLLPFQMSALGYTNPSVSATNQFYNVVAIPSGVWRYIREGRMVWPLTAVVAVGTLPGVMGGAALRVFWLPNPNWFKLFVACVLFYIGAQLIRDLLGEKKPERENRKDFMVHVGKFSLKRITYSFQGVSYSCSTGGVFALSLAVGVIGGAYGIGGGAIIAPCLVSWFGLPVHTTSGATLMGTFLTSVAGVIFYSLIAPFFPGQSVAPDWLLGLLFGLGGMAGMYLGARCQKFMPAKAIKWMLGLVITGTALNYVREFILNL